MEPISATIYISFHPKDIALEGEFEIQLTAALENLSEVKILTSTIAVAPGDNVEEAQQNSIRRADLFLLLLSADYVTDKRSLNERKLALARQAEAAIIPVLLRAVTVPAELQRLQIIPRDQSAVKSASGRERDEILFTMVSEISPIIRKVLGAKKALAEAEAKRIAEAQERERLEAEIRRKAEAAEQERLALEAQRKAEAAEQERLALEEQNQPWSAETTEAEASSTVETPQSVTLQIAEKEETASRAAIPVTSGRWKWLAATVLLVVPALWAILHTVVRQADTIVTPISTEAASPRPRDTPSVAQSTHGLSTVQPELTSPDCPLGMLKIKDSFCINETEVTVGEYLECERAAPASGCAVTRSTSLQFKCNRGSAYLAHPQNCVNQSDAMAYCQWKYKGRQGSIPTEQQWMIAVNGDAQPGKRTFKPNPSDVCWQKETTCEVKSYPLGRTKSGLYDAIGNVAEWTKEPYNGDATYAKTCGRSWAEKEPHMLIGACAGGYMAGARVPEMGFRCVATPSRPATMAP